MLRIRIGIIRLNFNPIFAAGQSTPNNRPNAPQAKPVQRQTSHKGYDGIVCGTSSSSACAAEHSRSPLAIRRKVSLIASDRELVVDGKMSQAAPPQFFQLKIVRLSGHVQHLVRRCAQDPRTCTGQSQFDPVSKQRCQSRDRRADLQTTARLTNRWTPASFLCCVQTPGNCLEKIELVRPGGNKCCVKGEKQHSRF